MPTHSKSQILTPNQVAELMMVSPATIRQWAAKGILKALTTPGGHRRFRMSDITAFAQKQGITLNIDEPAVTSAAVLIVDDDKQFAHYLKELILSFDLKVDVRLAYDGFETGKLLHTYKTDLVLMDLMMPKMDGFDTCQSIKADPSTAHIRVICMTGYSSDENIRRIRELGAEDCLSKPIDENIIEQYVRSVVENIR